MIYPSIHLFSTAHPGSSHRDRSRSKEAQTFLSLVTSQVSRQTQFLQLILGLPLGLLPEGHALNTLPGFQEACEHIAWATSSGSTQRSSGSTTSSFQMTDLLNLSLRKSPVTLWRKLILAACSSHLVHYPNLIPIGEGRKEDLQVN